MPLYDYKCSNCSHRFDIRQPFGSESVLACPECGSDARRQYHSMAIIYKGSGFYTTDYARKHLSPSGESSSSNGSSDESKSGDSKSGEPKSGEPKSGESKSSESKGSESTSSESKSGSSTETSTKTSSDASHSHPH